MKVVLFTQPTQWGESAGIIARTHFDDVTIISKKRGSMWHEEYDDLSGDLLISFQSPFIHTHWFIERFKRAINFHPGTHDYPGTGCYNWAIYERAKHYGCVCHEMIREVDSGRIISECIFETANETVESLKTKTLSCMLMQFNSLLPSLMTTDYSEAIWTRKPFTYKDLEHLKTITPEMSAEEVELRIRATTIEPYEKAYTIIHGRKFEVQ